MLKYFCDDYGTRGIYLRGRCGNDDYSSWITVETAFDAKNNYLTKDGLPRWKVENINKGKIIDSPLQETQEEIDIKLEKEYKAKLREAMPDIIDKCTSWAEVEAEKAKLRAEVTAEKEKIK
jgi:hypothetical protein